MIFEANRVVKFNPPDKNDHKSQLRLTRKGTPHPK